MFKVKSYFLHKIKQLKTIKYVYHINLTLFILLLPLSNKKLFCVCNKHGHLCICKYL